MPNYRRFVDRKDARELIKNTPDFNYREHGIPINRIIFYFVGTLLLTIWLINNLLAQLLQWPAHEEFPPEKIEMVLITVVICASIAGVIATYILVRVKHIIMATEFQNLIFANCMKIDSEFCLVVHKDKKGIYCDYNFSKMFSHIDQKAEDPFHLLLASQGFTPDEEKELLEAMQNNVGECFAFTHKASDGKVEKLQITLDPIEKPKGFFLIRGHKVGANDHSNG